jgi:hypothetical protein
MLKLTVMLALGVCGFLTGCAPVVSLHPLVPDDEGLRVDLSYTGLWKDCNGDDILKVEGNGDRGYRYQEFSKDGGSGQVRLVDLEGARFADIVPEGGAVSAHILARVRLEGDTLYFSFLAEGPTSKALPHETVGAGKGEQVILTGSTADLRKFLLLVRNQPQFFEEETALCRVN